MIISRTPYRISFFGGGTDYPVWYMKYGGAVISTAIDKYCYVTCRTLSPFYTTKKVKVVYARTEDCTTIADIEHPTVREVLRCLDVTERLEISHAGDLPARSGLGSSSAFTVGLLKALCPISTPVWLATQAIDIEQNCIGEVVGCQDQIATAFGGFNHITFSTEDHYQVNRVNVDSTKIMNHLMLFHTGTMRIASEIANSYAHKNMKVKQFEPLLELVNDALDAIAKYDMNLFGELLHEAWMIKRKWSSTVTNDKIDSIYDTARKHGAIGGKLLGAGGGGFILLCVPPDKHDWIKEGLDDLIHIPFKVEYKGSTIIYKGEENDN